MNYPFKANLWLRSLKDSFMNAFRSSVYFTLIVLWILCKWTSYSFDILLFVYCKIWKYYAYLDIETCLFVFRYACFLWVSHWIIHWNDSLTHCWHEKKILIFLNLITKCMLGRLLCAIHLIHFKFWPFKLSFMCLITKSNQHLKQPYVFLFWYFVTPGCTSPYGGKHLLLLQFHLDYTG